MKIPALFTRAGIIYMRQKTSKMFGGKLACQEYIKLFFFCKPGHKAVAAYRL